jgi:hypothetical protein
VAVLHGPRLDVAIPDELEGVGVPSGFTLHADCNFPAGPKAVCHCRHGGGGGVVWSSVLSAEQNTNQSNAHAAEPRSMHSVLQTATSTPQGFDGVDKSGKMLRQAMPLDKQQMHSVLHTHSYDLHLHVPP